MQFTAAASVDDLPPPRGIGLIALLLCALAAVGFVSSLMQVSGGTLAALVNPGHLPTLFSSCVLVAIESYIIWSYWKGKDWARICLLIASFLIVADEISTIAEHDGNLVVVMSHPVRFLKFVLAIFLLYWLNARPMRAWFKNAPTTAADLICSQLAGKLCTAIEKDAPGSTQVWQLAFEHDAELMLNCPWRIVMDDNLAFVSNPSSNITSNPVLGIPADEELPRQLLQNLRVKDVRVTPLTSDLFITFEMGLELQTWSTDAHREQWKFSDPTLNVIADAKGLESQAIAAAVPAGDSVAND